jgi:hypothetical protein
MLKSKLGLAQFTHSAGSFAMKRNLLSLFGAALVVLAFVAPSGSNLERICLIDEDMLDNSSPAILELAANGLCDGGDPAECVNDHIADEGLRVALQLPPGTIIGNGVPGGTTAPLSAGELYDEGLFEITMSLPEWDAAGPTNDGLINYLVALAPFFGNPFETLLDKIPGVIPQRTADLQAHIGETCCAVVYDSDINYNEVDDLANLQGANYGVVRFTLLAVGPDPEGSVLPDITIRIENPSFCMWGVVPTENTTWGRVKSLYR